MNTPIPDWAWEVAKETFPIDSLRGARQAPLAQAIANAHQRATQTLTCVYCGQAYPPGTPTSQHELLTAHIRVCEKHPMRKIESQRDQLVRKVQFLRQRALDAMAITSAEDHAVAQLLHDIKHS